MKARRSQTCSDRTVSRWPGTKSIRSPLRRTRRPATSTTIRASTQSGWLVVPCSSRAERRRRCESGHSRSSKRPTRIQMPSASRAATWWPRPDASRLGRRNHMTSLPRTLGVVGAGTMGAGIAQLGVGAGMRTLLHDPIPEALERGADSLRAGLGKWRERGREVDEGLFETAHSLEDLAPCDLVIEAAPERAE